MPRQLIPCPSCAGAGKQVGFACRPVDDGSETGSGGLTAIPCLDCGGAGEIVERPAEWRALGAAQRKRRGARCESLREMALRTKVSPVQLSDEERGRVEPLGDRE